MRFKRGSRARGKPGKLQLCYLELCEHRRGKQMMLREWSLKAVCHGCLDERFRRQNTRPLITSTTQRTKFSPPSALLQRKRGWSIVEQNSTSSNTAVKKMGQLWSEKEKGQPVKQMLPSRILFSWKEKGVLLLSQVFSLNLSKRGFPFSNYSHLHRQFIWRNLPAQGDLAEALREQDRIL